MLADQPRPVRRPAAPGPCHGAPTVRLPLAGRVLAPLAAPTEREAPASVRLTFAEPGIAGEQAAVAGLRILGVAPRRVRRLRVMTGDDTHVLDIDTVANGRGGELTAGEMLAAMSAMDGHADLTVPLPLPNSALRGLAVHLHLSDSQPWSDACITVQACLT